MENERARERMTTTGTKSLNTQAKYILNSAKIVITQTLCEMRHRLKIHSPMVLKKYVKVLLFSKRKQKNRACIHSGSDRGRLVLDVCVRATKRASEALFLWL